MGAVRWLNDDVPEEASRTTTSESISATQSVEPPNSTLLRGNLWWLILVAVMAVAFVVLLFLSLCVHLCIRRKRRALGELQGRQQQRLERAASDATVMVDAYETESNDACSMMDVWSGLETAGSDDSV